MKLLFTLLLLMSFAFSKGQYCGSSGPFAFTMSEVVQYGYSPVDDDAPCIVKGVYYEHILSSILSDSLILGGTVAKNLRYYIDTIAGLPCGICAVTNRINNQFVGGDTIAIMFKGITNNLKGQYPVFIEGHMTSNGMMIPQTADYTPDYHLRLIDNAGDACPALQYMYSNNNSDCATSIKDEIFPTSAVHFSGNSLIIKNAPLNTTLSLFDLWGREVLKSAIEQADLTLAVDLPPGIYIAQIGTFKAIKLAKN